mgnify:CR=1 FL=1
MTEGTIKTSKYEIIAIFREELRKRTEIEIFFNNTSIITQLTRVDFAEFHIQTHRKIPSGHKIRFLLHSDSGKIEFNAALTKHDNSGVDKGIRYAFSLPECLQVVQRRRDPRFRLRHEHDFYCRGRHKNGENYLFDIKDISDGGCALMTKTPNLKFLSHNALLKNAVLMLAEYGEITIDLVVKNVIVITLDNANEESESYYQISCQFKFRHLDDQRRIEKILLDLILEAKRKKENLTTLDSILLYTNDNLIGHSIYHYLIDSHENATRLSYADVIHEKHLPLAQTIIFNLINKDISAIRIVDLLNALRLSLLRCQQPVLMVKSDIVGLCRELINFDNAMIISEKSPLTLFSSIVQRAKGVSELPPRGLRKQLSPRECQILELLIANNNNKRIAALLGIAHKTVHSHRIHIMQKLGIDNSRTMNQRIAALHQC